MRAARLTARSVVLSVLLGAHPAWATAAELVALTAGFGIKESALRVALTRMVAAGDLVRSADGFRLADRLLARQRRQDDALHPVTTAWDSSWVTCVVTDIGADARARAGLRTALQQGRFGELREGVWLRPNNLPSPVPDEARDRVRVLTSRDDDGADLAASLWDLPGWAREGTRLLREMDRARDIPGRFTVAAAMVRHLLTDPVLPATLLPARWPGERLRESYTDFATELAARRDPVEVP